MALGVIWSVLLLPAVLADFPCLCDYGGGATVFSDQYLDGTLGTMQQFECGPIMQVPNLLHNITAINYKQKVGYVVLANMTKIQTCAGSPNVPVVTDKPFTIVAHTVPTDAPTLPPTPAPTTPLPTVATTTAQAIPEGHLNLCPSHMVNDATHNNGFVGQFGNYCYELVEKLSTWEVAERHCRVTSSNGHLLQILTPAEQDYVTRFLATHHFVQSVWTGLNDRSHEGHFAWASGSPVNYIHTGVQFTSNVHHSMDDCFLFMQGGDWSDVPCGTALFFGIGVGEAHPYICQYNVSSKPPDIFSSLVNIVLG